MNTNSPAKSRPAASPARPVPSAPKSATPRRRAQQTSSTVAMIERSAACITSGTSAAIHLTATCWKPHSAVSSSITPTAMASTGALSSLIAVDSLHLTQRRDFGVTSNDGTAEEKLGFARRNRRGAHSQAPGRLLLAEEERRAARPVRDARRGRGRPPRRRLDRGGLRRRRIAAGGRVRDRRVRVDRSGYRRAPRGQRPSPRRPLKQIGV